MPENSPVPILTPDKKKGFSKTVSRALFRHSSMKKKVKTISRVLSGRKKSWQLSLYSPLIFKDGESCGKYDVHSSPTAEPREPQQCNDANLIHTDNITRPKDVAKDNKGHNSVRNVSHHASNVPLVIAETAVCVEEFEEMIRNFSPFIQEVNQVELCAKTKPDICPPTTAKKQLYVNPKCFESLDRHAIELTRRGYTSLSALCHDLTAKCNSELEKTRALFRWVIAMDQKNAQDKTKDSNNLIGTGKQSCQRLFYNLCRQAGLHCEIIVGYSKGAGYRPGMSIKDGANRNSWTAVAIDGTWRFVNCTWAARHMTGKPNDLSQLLHKYDEFYFLTDPVDNIYQHFPDDPKWQLLEKPINLNDFCNLPTIKSPFFKHGLSFASKCSSTLITATGVAEIRVTMPRILQLGSRLEKAQPNNDELENCVLQRIVKDEAVFTVTLPDTGSFYFSAYAGTPEKSGCLECIFSTRIICNSLERNDRKSSYSYPSVSCLGPTAAMQAFNVSVDSHCDPLIQMNGNSVRIDFTTSKDTKFTHTLQYYDTKSAEFLDIDRYAFVKSRTDSDLSFSVTCPKKGYYIFSLFGANANSTTYDCLCQYLLVCRSDDLSHIRFPKTFQSWRNCVLLHPLSGDLVQETTYQFSLKVDNAETVFVLVGNEKHHLYRTPKGIWTGDVYTGDTVSTVTAFAEYKTKNGNSYYTRLLEYDLL